MTVPAPEDLELAADDALLQLRIGRGAHLLSVFAAAALALDGVLLLFLYPKLPTLSAGTTGAAAIADSFYLLIPIVAGLAVAAFGVYSKWEAFQLWPWELHFSASVGALIANGALAVVYGGRIAGAGSFASLTLMPWFYAVALAGISVAFLALALTWTAWSWQQWAASITAVLPVATALLVWFPPATTDGTSSALAVSLFLSAILFLISGSFLHLISSGTRPHERELITSGQSRMFRLADEIRRREEVVYFREAAVVKREADAENGLASIRRQNESLKTGRQMLDDLEEQYRERSDALVAKERTWAGQIGQIDARQKLLEDKAAALDLREQDVQRLLPQLSAREERLVDQEGQLTRREVTLVQGEQDLARRTTAVQESESRLDRRRRDLDRQSADLVKRESGLTVAAAGTGAAAGLAIQEAELRARRAALDEEVGAVERRGREAAERVRSTEEMVRRTTEREATVSAREARAAQREAEMNGLLKAADARRAEYDQVAKDYQGRLAELERHEADIAQRRSDVERSIALIASRESAVDVRERAVGASLASLELRERSLTEREHSLAADEAEVSLRQQEVARAADLPIAGLAALAVADRLDQPARPSAVGGRSRSPEGGASAETLSAPTGRRESDRRPTGTPRLDDLLLGGLPPGAHVVVVGDAFVGKEVVLYAFLAEGLKLGEPAVIVTASRSPSEIAENLGLVLPQLREYEQMGMIRWIDASGSATAEGDSRIATQGPEDRAGLLTALEQVSAAAEGDRAQPFRVGFLGLSAVLAQGDEREGYSFLQNVVGTLKPHRALAMYSLEPGALSDAQVETLLTRMDGAIRFRQDRDRTFLSVQGFGGVQTRDWVECRATRRSLIVGSFALERIR